MADDEDEAPGVPEWVVTFGDMMSLLLTFFIMLVSLSEIKQVEKYQALVESIKKQLGHDTSFASMVPGPVKPRNSQVQQVANLARAKRKDLMKGGAKIEAPVGENKLVLVVRPGKRTSVGTVVQFEETSLELLPLGKQALRTLAKKLKGKPQKIEVRGHVSQRPLLPTLQYQGHPIKTHTEFAFYRAKVVADFLVSDPEIKIPAHRIRISSGSFHEPAHTGIDPVLMKKNSRVDVVSLDETAGNEAELKQVPVDSVQ